MTWKLELERVERRYACSKEKASLHDSYDSKALLEAVCFYDTPKSLFAAMAKDFR